MLTHATTASKVQVYQLYNEISLIFYIKFLKNKETHKNSVFTISCVFDILIIHIYFYHLSIFLEYKCNTYKIYIYEYKIDQNVSTKMSFKLHISNIKRSYAFNTLLSKQKLSIFYGFSAKKLFSFVITKKYLVKITFLSNY